MEPPAEHGNLAENTALIRNLEHAGVRARVAPDLQGSPAWRAACDCWRNGRRPVAPCEPAYPGTESGIASTFGPPPRSASCGWPTATAPTSLPSTPANWPRRPQWKPGLEHLPGSGAVLRELLATLGRDAWLYLSDRAVHGCLQLLALLHSRGALEITDILLRDVGSGDPVYRGPAKFDGSVVEWFNGALFQEFARRAFPDCHFDIQSLAKAGKRHMTRLEVRRG